MPKRPHPATSVHPLLKKERVCYALLRIGTEFRGEVRLVIKHLEKR